MWPRSAGGLLGAGELWHTSVRCPTADCPRLTPGPGPGCCICPLVLTGNLVWPNWCHSNSDWLAQLAGTRATLTWGCGRGLWTWKVEGIQQQRGGSRVEVDTIMRTTAAPPPASNEGVIRPQPPHLLSHTPYRIQDLKRGILLCFQTRDLLLLIWSWESRSIDGS